MCQTKPKPRKRPQRASGGNVARWLLCVGPGYTALCLLCDTAPRIEVRVGIIVNSTNTINSLDVHFAWGKANVYANVQKWGTYRDVVTFSGLISYGCTPNHHQIYRREIFLAPTKYWLLICRLVLVGQVAERSLVRYHFHSKAKDILEDRQESDKSIT